MLLYFKDLNFYFLISIVKNKYYGKAEWDLLSDVCKDMYPHHELMLELQSGLLDIEARNSAMSSSRNVIKTLEAKIKQAYFKSETDAEELKRQRRARRGETDDDLQEELDDTVLDEDESDNSDNNPSKEDSRDYEEEEC